MTRSHDRTILRRNAALIGVALALAAPVAVAAEPYPTKPIRMVVPFAPGGISDILARLAGEQINAATGQPVVIDNRAGASGNIGIETVARAPGDGYTLLFAAPAFATNVSLYSNARYDPVRDFAPVAQVASATNVMVVAPALGVRNVKQLIDLANQKPGALNYGSGGAGTSGQLAAELLQLSTNAKLTHVPYKGAGPALTALLGNEVQLMFSPVLLVVPHINSGRLLPLAVTSAERSKSLPNVPTVSESAVLGFDVTSWFGVVAPASISRDKVLLLHSAITRGLARREVAERLLAHGADPVVRSPELFGSYIKVEVDKWARVIKAANIKAN